ncbi:hypothetical protein SH1V18_47580 [Vallitalea longa]|uniref:Non-canonical purine NTP pyrophosphatase n=1 Tax=Vallitalea longa TaxID=2936439 RepID=A0A9W5YJ38_9FIRM|nr:non-canonical purine NTP pyrophosphatase [Vallitalea longa]GKX32278.1 hypothetical protein SH1V18_47580 [Vallitalea longa]
MDIIYGTYNPGKYKSMVKRLKGLDINLIPLNSFDRNLEEADENGKEPLDNAIAKAQAYYRQLKRPVFSCDSGLFFDNVDEDDQPGVYIKRVKGKTLTDLGMQSYYSNLASKYGGRLTAYYKNSICLIINDNIIYKYDGQDINSDKFYIVSKPHNIFQKGYPLDSLSVNIKTNKYYYDMDEQEYNRSNGFRKFFIRVLKLQ